MNITTIGGGSGQPPIIVGLTKLFHDMDVNINAVVGTWDNGGSSGKLRDLYGIMPPGDILKCIMAFVTPEYRHCANMLLRRFDRTYPKMYDHNAGNLLLTALQAETDPITAIRILEKTLNVQGHVYPLTEHETHLHAEMARVKSVIVDNEAEIADRIKNNYRITKLWLEPTPQKLPSLEILEKTDVLIISPGSIFTSIMPHFTIREICEACEKIPTKIIMANFIERNMTSEEFLNSMNIWTRINPTHAIFNSVKFTNENYLIPNINQLLIERDMKFEGIKCISRPIIKEQKGLIRHDPKRSAAAIMEVLSRDGLI